MPELGCRAIELNPFSALAGKWSPDCEPLEGINLASDGSAIFSINSNQIYVKVHAKETSPNVFNLFLDAPSDLGAGGMRLSWDNFSRTTPIAVFSVISPNEVDMKWRGFFDNKTKKYQWAEGPDFYENSDLVKFHRCI